MKTYTLEDVRKAFIEGFRKGRLEQIHRDFPDVGFRLDVNEKEYWEEYKEKKNLTPR